MKAYPNRLVREKPKGERSSTNTKSDNGNNSERSRPSKMSNTFFNTAACLTLIGIWCGIYSGIKEKFYSYTFSPETPTEIMATQTTTRVQAQVPNTNNYSGLTSVSNKIYSVEKLLGGGR